MLAIGGAFGDELLPIITKIKEITILEPSNKLFAGNQIQGKPTHYVKPKTNGDLPFTNKTFDLITCFGTLHHIPNVSHVISECYRCLNVDGIMLVREPIVSMGDWRKPRPHLTTNERGIPFNIFKEIVLSAGFIIKHQSLCVFSLIPKILSKINVAAYNSKAITFIDAQLCFLLSRNVQYHRIKRIHKFGPSSLYLVLQKTG